MPRLGLIALLLWVAVPPARADEGRPPDAASTFFEYLHIEANEGGSSGGHVAVRFGDDTFHFQHEAGGLIRLRRDEAAVFDTRYALFENRPIHVTRVAVSADTYARLRDAFAHLLLVENAQYEHLEALRDDVTLLELWRRRAGEHTLPATIAVRGAGYFLADGFAQLEAGTATSEPVARVRAQVAARYGGDFLLARIAALRGELATWQPIAVRGPAPVLDRDREPIFPATASTDFAGRLEAVTALEVLAAALPLPPAAMRPADVLPPLDAGERTVLARFADQLGAHLVALAGSRRPDFGFPLLLGLARLAAIEDSLRSGRLVVLDRFPRDGRPALLPTGAGERTAFFAALADQLADTAARNRSDLFGSSEFREADYTALETTTNRLLEVEGARAGRGDMRVDSAAMLPARTATRAELIAPPLPVDSADRELAIARRAAAEYHDALAALYGYDLLSRNCVSEVFTTMASGMAGPDADGATITAASRRELGGVVRTSGTLNFIPVVSASAVASNFATVGQRTHRSYRQLRVQALARDEPQWWVALRESNTLTATAYHASPYDSTFLFFTDDAAPLRPLLGAANLVFGIADGVLGLTTWPFDAGHRLQAGFRGALFSLPELAFVNIRKGSMAWVEPEYLRDAAAP